MCRRVLWKIAAIAAWPACLAHGFLCTEALLSLDVVEDGLFLSGAPSDLSILDARHIDAVIKIGMPWESPSYQDPIRQRVKVFSFPDERHAPFDTLRAAVLELASLRQQGVVTLVHCGQGVSRSATVTAIYLMGKEDLSWDEALQRIRRVRSIVQPHEKLVTPAERESIAQEVRQLFK